MALEEAEEAEIYPEHYGEILKSFQNFKQRSDILETPLWPQCRSWSSGGHHCTPEDQMTTHGSVPWMRGVTKGTGAPHPASLKGRPLTDKER